MSLLDRIVDEHFEQVMFCYDAATGLRSIIAIHDTTLGPALGGVRMLPYAGIDAALDDCLRLARTMTYKSAAAGLSLGGGKSVIIGDSRRDKTPELLRAHGRYIAVLGGRYIPGIDVGTTAADMRVLAEVASEVSCTDGDPSYFTALGVFSGITAAAHHLGLAGLAGLTVAVQGAGHVGAHLVRLLVQAEAKVLVSDMVADRVAALAAELGVASVDPDELLSTQCDVLAPCALGGVVHAGMLDTLRCRAVAGAANNVLAENTLAVQLAARDIVFVPDFLLSAGGVTWLDDLRHGGDDETARVRVLGIGERVTAVLDRARREGIDTITAAVAIAEERLVTARAHSS